MRHLGASALGALLLAISPAPLFALSPGDPTPIGLPDQPGDPATPAQDDGSAAATGQGGINSAPLPPLPPAAPELPPSTNPTSMDPNLAQPPAADATAGEGPGLLDDSNAGLGASIWQGSSGAKLISLLPKLPAPQTQPSLRDLQLRLLLTKAPGPNAGDGIDTLVPLRAERLHAMGFSAEAMLLSNAATDASAGVLGAFEKALTADDTNAACAKVDEVVASQQMIELYWRKALIYCQVAREQDGQASLGLDLLRESADKKDTHTKDFITLAAGLLGESKLKKVKLGSSPDPLLAAMMRKAGLKVPAAEGAAPPKPAGLAGDAAVARDASQPLERRIESGERAFAGGLVSADEMIGIYRQANFAGDPLAMPDSPLMRAQLYQAADQAFDPLRRAQFVQLALQNARARGMYFSQGALYRPIADRITPAPNLAWFAPEAARLMLWSGNVERGGFWLNLAQGSQAGQPDVARSVPGLELLAQIAGLTGNYAQDPILAWQQAGGNPGLAERLRGIQAGLGLPGGIATAATGDAAAIAPAAQAGRRGETVLLALVALGSRGLASADGATLAQSLGGLGAVGLNEEARRIGLEAAILAGL